jgi:hypothetical protein
MSENPQPQAEQQPGDLGLSTSEWHDLAIAYNHGLIEAAEGTVEAEAFRRMDAYARQEAMRAGREREREWAASRDQRPGQLAAAEARYWATIDEPQASEADRIEAAEALDRAQDLHAEAKTEPELPF